ncbi:MAG: toprim domain-containing protein [Paraprevotella sp.]|nr:toprim domain-containing protein [Paraprevotella sp.]
MKRFPIEDFLARLGHHPVQRRANAVWYRSPYREERTPSFKVHPERNLWFDFGEGKGGNIFALAGEFIGSGDFTMQVGYVAEVAGMPVQEPRNNSAVRQPAGASFEDVEVLPLQNRALIRYLQERGIPSAIAIANCKEIHYTTHGKRYFAVAFGNGSGGYEIRNPFFKGCVPPKDMTLLPSGSTVCNVYEGFMDYLSARVLGIGNGEDHLVLNSVSNVAKAFRHLDGYGQIKCHFDNDEAGRRTLEALCARYGERVSDCSGVYGGCQDMNEHLQKTLAERQVRRENEKKSKSIKM